MSIAIERRHLAGIDFTIAEPSDTAAETLICLHGIGGDDGSFLLQTESLSDRYRVIAWNMPGYAQSLPLSDYTFENLANALSELISQLQVDSVHLVGQSIGGMVAQEFAHRYPEQLKSLVLIATTSAFGGRDDSFKNAFLDARLKPLDEGVSMAELALLSVPEIIGKNASIQAHDSAVASMSKVNTDTYREVLRCLVTFNRFKELEQIVCPVCFIAGSEDTNAPAATMQKMAGKLTHAEYHELDGGGHLVNLEMPGQTNHIMASFLDKHF